MSIPRFSVIPSRLRPATFSPDMDQMLSEFPAVLDAIESVEQSLQLVATTGTSATSITISTGSHTFTTQPGKAWAVGSWLYVVSAASVANMLVGQVTAHNPATGAVTISATSARGSGAFSAWVIGLSAPDLAGVSPFVHGLLGADDAASFKAAISAQPAGDYLASTVNTWAQDSAGGQRQYYESAGTTYFRAYGAIPYRFLRGDGAQICTFSEDGRMQLLSNGVYSDDVPRWGQVQDAIDAKHGFSERYNLSGAIYFLSGIPVGVKRLTLIFTDVSTNGAAAPMVQIGDGTIATSGYVGTCGSLNNGSVGAANFTNGFHFDTPGGAAFTRSGTLTLTRMVAETSTWVASGVFGQSDQARASFCGGRKTLGGALIHLQIATSNGTDQFDGGSVQIHWEL